MKTTSSQASFYDQRLLYYQTQDYMKLRLLALVLIVTTFACKKEYSYEGGPTPPQKQKQLCNSIVGKRVVNDSTGNFMLGDWQHFASINVSIDVYNSHKVGDWYCDIPLCGRITNKQYFTNDPTFTWVGSVGGRTYDVVQVVSQAEYDKYIVGDDYCYTP